MKRLTLCCVVLVCALVIGASAADLHCAVIRPSGATLVVACSAGRWEARP